MSEETTSAALLEQLVYIDNYINGNASTESSNGTPNLDIDGQLSLDLAAFADDSFIFPDEEKKHNNNEGGSNGNNNNNNWSFNDFNNNNNHHQPQKPQDSFNVIDFHQMDIKQEQQQHQPQLPPAPPQVQQPHSNENFNLGSNAFLNLTDLPKFPVPPGAKSSLVNAGLSSNQIDLLSALVAQHQASLGNTIPLQTPITTTTSTSSVNTPLSVSPSELPLRSSNSQLQLHTQLSTSSQNLRRLSISSQSSNNTLLDPILSSSSTSPPSGSAAELDKKRRNTAASARFRFKKKLKEKQMETKIQNLEELIVGLESQLNNLEMENKLLRNLIIEKGSQKSEDEVKLLKEKARME
ncbi:hypothetical protein G210_1111 [Candida maltosa Xu316]|uniref:BZIP domain-containing protein n=1 Tax=Candida maltosa (strain Xu316) TaxID=1245528 RepID=M3K0U9_CANMX|nr:hypothetical protein G210_1111 [Candida maltosa Xu316]